MPCVYIIILNWNSWRDTIECIDSIQHLTYPNYRVLVVDNASGDGSERHIRNAYPQIEFIQTGANLGYAGGNNAGIRYALSRGSDYMLILNPDVALAPETLTQLVRMAETDPTIGALSPVIRFKDQPEVVWFGYSAIDWQNASTFHHQVPAGATGFLDSAWASGCCLLLKAGALRRTGLFDERYFLYFEESDLCQRLRSRGYKVGVCTNASAFHQVKNRETNKVESPLYIYYMTRNALLFFLRYAARHGVSRRHIAWTLYRRHLFNRAALGALRQHPTATPRVQACIDFALGHLGPSAQSR